MLTHDALAFALHQLYPDLAHGRDFWVAQPVAPGSAQPLGAAEIIAWPTGVPHPSVSALQAAFEQQAAAFYASRVRADRDARLYASDWTQLFDLPTALRQAWARYRQALREVPQQAGFPTTIQWPQPPSPLDRSSGAN